MKAFLSYMLVLGGLGLVTAAVLGAYMINLSYPSARLRIVNMLRQNVNQAELMCRAAKGTFYEPLGGAIKTGVMVPTTDIKIIQMSTKPGYDGGIVAVKMAWKKLFGRGKMGVMMIAGGVTLAFVAKTSPVLHIIIAVLAGGAAVWFYLTRAENERSLVRARAEILPEIDQAIANGRYVRTG